MPNRRDVLRGLTAAIPALALSRPTRAAPRKDVCLPCTGNGNCISGNCQGGVCMPTSNPCAGRPHRKYFFCKNGAGACCKGGAKKCRTI